MFKEHTEREIDNMLGLMRKSKYLEERRKYVKEAQELRRKYDVLENQWDKTYEELEENIKIKNSLFKTIEDMTMENIELKKQVKTLKAKNTRLTKEVQTFKEKEKIIEKTDLCACDKPENTEIITETIKAVEQQQKAKSVLESIKKGVI